MDIAALDQSFRIVQEKLGIESIRHAMILGSGWGDIAEAFTVRTEMPYDTIPAMGATGVIGHKGRLLLVESGTQQALIFQGRRHWYEGLGWTPVALPVYIAKRMGAKQVWLTNAAGGINPTLKPGDLMMISDHINGMGHNPLVGPHQEIWGPRFPDQSRVYTPQLQQALLTSARASGHSIHQGVYLATSGPVYETPAEIRMFRQLGADAVGMSTVPEAVLASAAGLQVGAVSCITNLAAGVSATPLGHTEVLAATREAMPVMKAILHHVVSQLTA
ncbi:MAG: purine-nucleoside phosphorylase [Kiritimatiellia bacterium]